MLQKTAGIGLRWALSEEVQHLRNVVRISTVCRLGFVESIISFAVHALPAPKSPLVQPLESHEVCGAIYHSFHTGNV